MGWSATSAACRTMDQWTAACVREHGTQNGFTVAGVEYFWETGREQADGGITGAVYRMDGGRVGTFRIDPDGGVFRAPAVMKGVLT